MLEANELPIWLYQEIEQAWNERRDLEVVHTLARQHPDLAEELYDFFADLMEMTHAEEQTDPASAAQDAKVLAWLEREGLKRAQAAREVAPTQTTDQVQAVTPPALSAGRSGSGGQSLLGYLRSFTSLRVDELASALDLSPDLLTEFSRYIGRVPPKARDELVSRSHLRLGVPKADLVDAVFGVGPPGPLQRAASRLGAYRSSTLTYEQIVGRSQLDDDKKQYWLSLG